jgi:apolipoprotein D and lipocalin family protein
MKPNRLIFPLAVAGGAALALTACAGLMKKGRVGNRAVPQPARHVDLNRYLGLWYEIGRYENRFETDCEAVTPNTANAMTARSRSSIPPTGAAYPVR